MKDLKFLKLWYLVLNTNHFFILFFFLLLNNLFILYLILSESVLQRKTITRLTLERICRNTHISHDWSIVSSPVFSRHCPIASRSRTCPEQFLGIRRSLWEIKIVT